MVICACLILLSVFPANAVTQRYSVAEQVGFAFYKLGGAQPNFDQWIEAMDGYQTIREQDRPTYKAAQRQRLAEGFAEYNLSQSRIDAVADIILTIPKVSPEQISLLGGKRPMTIRLAEVESNYIPYYIGGQWIVMVLQNMEQFNEILLPEHEVEHIRRHLSVQDDQPLPIQVRLIVEPTQADMTSPVALPKADAWLLAAKILNFEIWSKESGAYVWGYQDQNFMHDEQRELLNLYHR